MVNTASMAAVTAIPGIGPYTASKHAVLGISDGLRGELAAIDAPDRGLRRDAGDDQDRDEPLRDRWGPSRSPPTCSTPCVAGARTCSPTITTSPRSSRVSARSWPPGPTWCRSAPWTPKSDPCRIHFVAGAGLRFPGDGREPADLLARGEAESRDVDELLARARPRGARPRHLPGREPAPATCADRACSAGRSRPRRHGRPASPCPTTGSIHSLHGYFLRGGQADRPTILHVDRDRDGRSFSARHVAARQDGEVIMSLLVSFHVEEDGPEYQAVGLPAGRAPARRRRRRPQGGPRTSRCSTCASSARADPPGKWGGPPHQFWTRAAARSPTTACCTRACSPTSPTSGPGSRS